MADGPQKLEKHPYQKSIFTPKSTEVLFIPIPHSASIYGRRIYLVTKERCKRKRAERQIREVMIKHWLTANERAD